MRFALVAGAVLSITACGGDVQRGAANVQLRDAAQVGRISDDMLVETSGLTRNSTIDALFWANNDSGNDPLIFAIDSAGASHGRWHVAGATNTDWEAIATGPCDSGTCLYIGDVGDNRARRRQVVLWRVREPSIAANAAALGAKAAIASTEQASRLTFSYQGGPRDVEAMWIAPDRSVWLVSKRPMRNRLGHLRPALLFRIAASAWHDSADAVAQLMDSIPVIPAAGNETSWVTDAAYASNGADGARVVIRTYQEALVFRADSLSGRPGALIARCGLRDLRERFGEAVAWARDGRLLFANEGRGSRLWMGRCSAR